MLINLIKWPLPVTVILTVIMVDAAPCCADMCTSFYFGGKLYINCSSLGLKELPEDLNSSVNMLDLSNNNFNSYPNELGTFTLLEELSLAGNEISGPMPNFVQNWKNLQVINLSNNNIETWSSYGLRSSLKKLDLSKNKISVVDVNAFKGIQALSYIDFSENRLSRLPTHVFKDLKNLDTVILAMNLFTEIPDFISFSIRALDLSNCQITELEINSFAGKSSLTEINLAINEIDSIPDNISSSTLQVLDLSYNDIGSLNEQTFSAIPHLAVLDLRGNNFKEVWQTSFFSANPYLREVHVKGNRWSCEGFSINLLLAYEFFTRDPPKVTDIGSLICYSPQNVTQMSWQDAYIKTWHPNETFDSMTVTAILIGITIGVILTGFACRCIYSMTEKDVPTASITEPQTQNLNVPITTEIPADSEPVRRIRISDDLPPSYDEALLMPSLNASFHSLPDFVEEEEYQNNRDFRRSRSINDLESRPRGSNRRSIRPAITSVVIDID